MKTEVPMKFIGYGLIMEARSDIRVLDAVRNPS